MKLINAVGVKKLKRKKNYKIKISIVTFIMYNNRCFKQRKPRGQDHKRN